MSSVNAGTQGSLVLVIDDDALMRLLVRETLEQCGFEVLEASNGPDGLATFRHAKPDAILLDIQLPGMDGFDVCRGIRECPHGNEVPILMLTGLEDPESVARAYEAGATDFASKPIQWEVLGHRVRYLLRSSLSLAKLRQSESRLAEAQEVARLGWWEWDLQSRTLEISSGLRQLLALAPEAPCSQRDIFKLVAPPDIERIRAAMRIVKETGEPGQCHIQMIIPELGRKHFSCHISPTLDPLSKGVTRLLGTVLDVSEHREQAARIRHLSYHDPLTNLPNRAYLHEFLSRVIRHQPTIGEQIGLIFIDLDNFSLINDTFGHTVGDELLGKVVTRMTETLRSTDLILPRHPGTLWGETLARVGGDEFAIVVRNLSHQTGLEAVARRITGALSAPFRIGEEEVSVSASIGGAVFPDHGDDSGSLFRNADSAIHRAKASGRQSYRLYTPDMNQQGLARLKMENDLRRAMDQSEFLLVFQPQVNLHTGEPIGFEALIRWQHPTGGRISPVSFIPVAEETGLIRQLGSWVLEESCRQLAEWHKKGYSNLTVSVNVSAKQLGDGHLLQRVQDSLVSAGLPPHCLELELTESALMENRKLGVEILEAIKETGVKIAIDDFGTGYSSLGKLRNLPIDTLKIDRSFIIDLTEDGQAAAVVQAIITMGQGLGQMIVAEGIETEEQRATLDAMGCPIAQGYFFSRPLEVCQVEGFLRSHRRCNAA